MTRMSGRLLAGGAGIAILAAVALTAATAWWGDEARATGQAGGAVAELRNAAGVRVGDARFRDDGNNVRVQVDVSGMPPGFHGFHVHAIALCEGEGGFASAGGHLTQPAGHPHAGAEHANHAGDMPSLYVANDGTGSASFIVDRFTIAELFDADGSALIIHAGPDNFANIPTRYAPAPDAMTLATGDAGGRIACAVIQR
jgi:superoxide dismutase, Cu-Zn family